MGRRISYYTDENVAKAIVKGLHQRGIDVLTCQEAGMLSVTDEQHLKLATEEGRVIFTHDADFLRLHVKGIEHAGIAYSANQEDIGGIIRNLKLIFDVLEAEDMVNKLEYV